MALVATNETQTDAEFRAIVHDFLDDYAYLQCREFGHSWKPKHKAWMVQGAGSLRVYTKTLLCRDCRTERVDTVDCGFEFLRRSYVYPDGYESRGMHMTRHDVRRWDIEQMSTASPRPATSTTTPPAPAQRTKPTRRKTVPR
jgi:hypothetical protein